LTKPEVSGVVKENVGVREPNLSRQYHASAERLQNMHAEAQRRLQNATGQPDNGTANGGGGSVGEENVARGEREGAQGADGGPAENAPTKEVSPENIAPAFAKAPAYHPDLQKIADKFGTSDDASKIREGSSFIAPDGKFIHLKGSSHDSVIDYFTERKAGTGTDNRIGFLNDSGAIRVRFNPADKAGPTTHLSVPKGGVTAEQIPAIRQAIAQAGRNGNVVMERADVSAETKNDLTMSKEFPRAADTEDYLRQIQAHPDQHGDVSANAVKKPKPAAMQSGISKLGETKK
jgi:hypothetical protein